MGSGRPARVAWRYAGAIAGVAMAGGALRYGMREFLNGASRRIEFDLRNDLFARLTTLDSSYYAGTRTGDIMARLTNDLGAVRMAAGPAVMYLTNTVFGGLFAIAFMLRISLVLTVLTLLPMVLLPVIGIRMGKALHDRFESVQEHFSTLTTRAQENLAGARIVRAYRQENAEIARFGALNDEYLDKNMHLVRLYGAMHPAFGLLAGLGAVAVLGVGGSLVVSGRITVGAFVAFGFYLGMLTWPLVALGWVINPFQRGGASMTRLAEVFDARPLVVPPDNPVALVLSETGRSIEFRDVSFAYPARGDELPRQVLTNVSFTVPAGATLALVGATGSGKSALLDLVTRTYDATAGDVLIDGVPVTMLDPALLRAEVGVVPQESFLFSESIAANLEYGMAPDGRDGDSVDGSAAHWAADVAQLSDTVRGFPGGFDTMLGERGINLSGGQKQRLALARALARRPSIVLLDDALSAVDTGTEAAILHALRTVLAGRTAVIASHRVSAVRDATHIIVLDQGRLVEQGTHDELFARGGRYWSLLRRQQLEESLDDGAGDEPVVASGAPLAVTEALATGGVAQ